MFPLYNKKLDFDIALANECAKTISSITNLGCSVSSVDGMSLFSYGLNCSSCALCDLSGIDASLCMKSHQYSLNQSERFDGKYIYFCPAGLTCFTSPVISVNTTTAQFVVGPFLMVDKQDFLDLDLNEFLHFLPTQIQKILLYLDKIPYVAPSKVNDLSMLLFMIVGFLNSTCHANILLEKQDSHRIQKNISSYIHQLKGLDSCPPYPFDTENKLLDAIAHQDKLKAQKYLNELFGYIFFSTGNDIELSKSRTYELLVLISRTSIKSGGDPEHCLKLTHEYLHIIPQLDSLDALATWLSKVASEFMDNLFSYSEVKHANVIYKAVQYMKRHYDEKIILEQMAAFVSLSPTYFSRVFKKELGQSFTSFLTSLRIEKSKDFLLDTDWKLIDIALAVGFEDQSYFTKKFKEEVGVPPFRFREQHAHILPK